MDYDILLEWMSERGSGSWHHFREAHTWLLTRGETDAEEVPAGRTLDHLARLGHVESARAEARWAMAPPVVTVVPGASVHAVLVGSRTRPLQRALREAIDGSRNLDLVERPQDEGPRVLYISCNDERALEDLAVGLGGTYEHSVSERLTQLLPGLDDLMESAAAPPPRSGYGVARWEDETHRFAEIRDTTEPGLYRYDVYGGHQYRFTDDGERHTDIDLHTGRYAELHRLGVSVFRYVPEAINGLLTVPVWADLPVLHARSAILCSGLLPEFNPRQRSLRYRNVPRTIAQRIAETLGQHLHIEGETN